jgi:hypothetical protein
MELQKNTEVKSTTHYWGYRELTAAELLLVSGGDHDDSGGSFDSNNYRLVNGEYVYVNTGPETAGDR